MTSLMLPEDEAMRKRAARLAAAAEIAELEKGKLAADTRKTHAEAFKNVSQGQKNAASADKTTVDTALGVVQTGIDNEAGSQGGNSPAND
jgi:hypothetical protein